MYMGVLEDCVGVAQLWWDVNPVERVALLKRRTDDCWALLKLRWTDTELSADLRTDWVCIWSGGRAEARGVMFAAFTAFLREEVADAFKTDI
jgi:hypothetical protein